MRRRQLPYLLATPLLCALLAGLSPVSAQAAAAEATSTLAEGCGNDLPGDFDRAAMSEDEFVAGAVSFTVTFGDEINPYRLMSIFVMPGESLRLEAKLGDRASRFEACAAGGTLARLEAAAWTWRAPSTPGIVDLHVTDANAGETMRLRAVVLRPYAGEDQLEGYRIGAYERVPLRGDPAYRVPPGLIEVTPENRDTWLSPHFQLRQFLCKQPADWPRFALVGTRLLLKLETLLEKVNTSGVAADTFTVMSGYRTPWYNASIGNQTRYSRHLYGDAADIYVDQDEDGQMDDLDGDGRVTEADAKLLYDIVESATKEAWYRPFVGGLGLYAPAPHRGPFIHVDTRGFRARW